MALETFNKDEDSALPWEIRWDNWLANEGNDTIDDAEVLVPDDLTVDTIQVVNAGTRVRVWLSAGGALDGAKHKVTCRIHTVAGRTEDKSFIVKMTDK